MTRAGPSRESTAVQAPSLLLWHPELHRQLAHEQLAFVSVGFQPRYQRDLALQLIDRAFADAGVRSSTVWELQRKPDLLIKLWVPAGKNTEDILQGLRAQAQAHPHVRLTLQEATFHALRTLSHYLWSRAVTTEDVDDVLECGGDFLVSGVIAERLPDEIAHLSRRQLVALLDSEPAGVKFFIWISAAELLPNERARDHLEHELLRVVNTTPNVYATSIFAGTGVADYLVTGRFKPEHYETLARDLQPRLSLLGDPFIATNTDTALSTLYGPIDRVEGLLAVDSLVQQAPARAEDAQSAVPIEELLGREESEHLEFKGSAFNVINERPNVRREHTEAEDSNRLRKVKDAITKSCTGFLNANGGRLVIGVVEASRVPLDAARSYSEDARQVGEYIVVGVDRRLEGKRAIAWDEFQRRLRTQLAESITPSPDPWISIDRTNTEGIDVAVITVKKPNVWFFAKIEGENEVFYVRYGNATRPLRGPAMLQHMRSEPRE